MKSLKNLYMVLATGVKVGSYFKVMQMALSELQQRYWGWWLQRSPRFYPWNVILLWHMLWLFPRYNIDIIWKPLDYLCLLVLFRIFSCKRFLNMFFIAYTGSKTKKIVYSLSSITFFMEIKCDYYILRCKSTTV